MAKGSKKVLDETIGAFKQLKEEVKAYKDELAGLTVGTEEWNNTAKKLAAAQKQVDAITQVAKGNLAAYNVEEVKSINDLKAKIKVLNQERNAMDMNSKEYKKATEELKVLNDQLREAGTTAGDWKANVGNYANSVKDAFSQLGAAAGGLTGSIGGLNAGMLKLATNPVGAAIAAIAIAIKGLVSGIKSSEENTNKWREAMAPLQAILVIIQRELQKFAAKFIDLVNGFRQSETAGKAFHIILQGLLTVFNLIKNRVKDIIDITKEVIDDFKRWGKALGDMFRPILDSIGNIAKKLKDDLQPAIDWVIKNYNKIASSKWGKALGLQTIEQVKKAFKDAGDQANEFEKEVKDVTKQVTALDKAEAAYQKNKRGLLIQQAKLESEVAEAERELQDAREAKDWDKAQEALNKKKEKEIALARVNVALAAAEANIIKTRNSLTENSTKDLDAEAAAVANLERAKGQEAATTAQLTKEQIKLNKQREADEKQKQIEAYKNAVAALNQELNTITATYTNLVASLNTPIKPEGVEIDTTSINDYFDALNANTQAEFDAYKDMVDAKIAKLEEFIAVEKAAGNDTLAFETQLAKMRQEKDDGFLAQQKRVNDTIIKNNKERLKMQTALNKSELANYANLFDSVSGLFEQNTIAYKATATAKALINTYLAATGALADTPGGPIARGVAMAATIAAGLAQVIAIWKTNPKGEQTVPSASNTTPAIAEPTVYETQPYTYTRTAQTFEEEEKLNQPIFVSVTDINNVQNKVRVTEDESTW